MLNHLKRSVVAAAAVLAVGAAPASAGYSHLLPPPSTCGSAASGDMSRSYYEWTAAAMCLVNAARAKHGAPTYAMFGNLLDSAYKKAGDISVCTPDVLAADPDGVGKVHRACGRPIDYHHRGWWSPCAGNSRFVEKVYLGSGYRSTPWEAVVFWLDSPAHWPDMLSRTTGAHGLMYSGPTTYPRVGPDTRIWVYHLESCRW